MLERVPDPVAAGDATAPTDRNACSVHLPRLLPVTDATPRSILPIVLAEERDASEWVRGLLAATDETAPTGCSAAQFSEFSVSSAFRHYFAMARASPCASEVSHE